MLCFGDVFRPGAETFAPEFRFGDAYTYFQKSVGDLMFPILAQKSGTRNRSGMPELMVNN